MIGKMRRNEFSFELVIITPDVLTPEQLHVIPDLLKAGASYVYLRSDLNTPDLQKGIEEIHEHGYASKLILPQVFTSVKGNEGYCHVKERQRRNPEQTYLPDASYSTSIHSLADLTTLNAAFQLVFYSPLFQSISKEGYAPKVALSAIQEELQVLKEHLTPLPKIIGLGGIMAENIEQVKQAGFDGAALLGSVWQASDPVAAFRAIKTKLES